MTTISSSTPLPAREGTGVGIGAPAPNFASGSSAANSLRSSPTPSPSLAGRGGISTDTSRLAGKENLKKAGEQFESVFTGMMLKSMRATKLADPLFDSKALDTFRDMQDQMTVKAMAEHTPLGIGKAMTDFLAKGAGAGTPDPGASADQTASQPDVNPSATTP